MKEENTDYEFEIAKELHYEMCMNDLLPETEIQVLVENDSLVDWYYSDAIERKLSKRDEESWWQYQSDKNKLKKTTIGEVVWNCEWISLGKPTIKSLAKRLGFTSRDISKLFLIDSEIVESWFNDEPSPVHYIERMMIKELMDLCIKEKV